MGGTEGVSGGGGRGSSRGGRRPRRVADIKTKEKNKADRRKPNNRKPQALATTISPSIKQMNAAVAAMKGAGYEVPDGMKVIISVTPTAALASAAARANNPRPKNNSQKKK